MIAVAWLNTHVGHVLCQTALYHSYFSITNGGPHNWGSFGDYSPGICLYQISSSFGGISITFDVFIILEALLVVSWVLSHLKPHNWGSFMDYSLGNLPLSNLKLFQCNFYHIWCFYHTWSFFGGSLSSITFETPQLRCFWGLFSGELLLSNFWFFW